MLKHGAMRLLVDGKLPTAKINAKGKRTIGKRLKLWEKAEVVDEALDLIEKLNASELQPSFVVRAHSAPSTRARRG